MTQLDNQSDFNTFSEQNNGVFQSVSINFNASIFGDNTPEPSNNRSHFTFIDCQVKGLFVQSCVQESIVFENCTIDNLQFIEQALCENLKLTDSTSAISFIEYGAIGRLELLRSKCNLRLNGNGCGDIYIGEGSEVKIDSFDLQIPAKLHVENCDFVLTSSPR